MNRTIHRLMAGGLGLPFLYIAATGTLTTASEIADPGSVTRSAARPAPAPPLRLAALAPSLRAAVADAERRAGATALGVIEVELRRSPKGPRLQVWAPGLDRTLVYDAKGQPVNEPATGQTARPFRLSTTLQDLHSGIALGRPVQAILLLSGIALAGMTLTGLLLYLDMLGRRRKAGRKGIFWK